jgi:hypothetical protein
VSTKHRKLTVRIAIADITMSQCNAIICMLNTQIGMLSGSSKDILRCIDQSITELCCQYIDKAEFETPLKTESTELQQSIKFILHTVIADTKIPDGDTIL